MLAIAADWRFGLPLSLAAAALMAAGALAAIRRDVPGLFLLVLGLAPSALVDLANPAHRVYSFHGFAHLAIVYRILTSPLPPEDPTFAGAPLLYPWAYHLVAAGLASALRISPATAFALINLAALAITLVALDVVAREALDDRRDARLGVLLAVFGLGFAGALYLNRPVHETFGVFLEFRGQPPATYFSEVNATSAGLAFYSLFLAALGRSLADERRGPGPFFLLAVSLAGCGLFYPFHFMVAVASALSACLLVALARRGAAYGRIAGVAAALAVAGLLLAPYLASLVAAKAPPARLQLMPGMGAFFANLVRLAALALPLAAVAFVERAALLRALRERPERLLVLVASTIVPTVLYLVVRGPEATEYKFLTLACLGAGVLASPAAAALARRRPGVAWAVVTLCLVPLGSDVLFRGFAPWAMTDRYVEDGVTLRHGDAEKEALYSWIRESSPRDAVFVDLERTVPVFGERPLFVAVGQSRGALMDGWSFSSRDLLERVFGHPAVAVAERQALVRAVASEDGAGASDEALHRAEQAIGGRPLFVVARGVSVRARLASDTRFRRVFEGKAGGIYRLGGEAS